MKLIKSIIGLVFMGIGIVWALVSKYSCNQLCGTCGYEQIAPCYFLFVFAGIILVISGASLVLTSKLKKTL